MHDRLIVHRDIKPENIFLSDGEICKIGDYGGSRQLNINNDFVEERLKAFDTTRIGTEQFMSPEIKNGEPNGAKADMWSLGQTFADLFGVPQAKPSDNQ